MAIIFVLTPKASNGNLKQFTINVGRDGTIHQFSAVEQDDQRSAYQLIPTKRLLIVKIYVYSAARGNDRRPT